MFVVSPMATPADSCGDVSYAQPGARPKKGRAAGAPATASSI